MGGIKVEGEEGKRKGRRVARRGREGLEERLAHLMIFVEAVGSARGVKASVDFTTAEHIYRTDDWPFTDADGTGFHFSQRYAGGEWNWVPLFLAHLQKHSMNTTDTHISLVPHISLDKVGNYLPSDSGPLMTGDRMDREQLHILGE